MLLYKLFEVWEPQKFEEHFKDIQKFYRERRDTMLAMVEKHLTGISETYCNNFYCYKYLNRILSEIFIDCFKISEWF